MKSAPLLQRLFTPLDIASLALFRIWFSAIMVWEVWRYFDYGWIERYWIGHEFHFKFYGWGWIHPMREKWLWFLDTQGVFGLHPMEFHWIVVGILGFLCMIGLFYRFASVAFLISFAYIFFLEKACYLNHFYAAILIWTFLCITPAHRNYSVDALIWKKWRSSQVPCWSTWGVRFLIGVVYFYAGVAKMNEDWIRGEPLHQWIRNSDEFPVFGFLMHKTETAIFMAWCGLLLDLLGPFFLLWRRTRLFTYAVFLSFHLSNTQLFNIGIFPWFMIAATTIYFASDWPRHAFRWFSDIWLSLTQAQVPEGRHAPFSWYHVKNCLLWLFMIREPVDPLPQPEPENKPLTFAQWFIVIYVGLFAAYNILMPLRHHIYPTRVMWTEEGHLYAWRMKLRQKRANAYFVVKGRDAEGNEWRDRVNPGDYLYYRQERKMKTRPDMILQFAHFLRDHYAKFAGEGEPPVEVYAFVKCSLNDRPYYDLIDPTRDLAKVERTLSTHDGWITEMQPLDLSLVDGARGSPDDDE